MKFGKVIKYITAGIYALCGLALLVFFVPATGFKAKSVATGSMRPAIPPGSLVIIQKVPLSSPSVGDVITFKNPANTKQTITHRIVSQETKEHLPFFTTKGDANPTHDQEIVGGLVLGKVVLHLPVVGALTDWVKTPLGLLVIIIVPGLLIIYDESRRLRTTLRQPRHQHTPPPEEPPSPPAAPPTPQAAVTQRPQASHRRPLDGMRIRRLMVIVLAVASLGVGTTRAAYVTNKVTLADNRLIIAATPSPSTSPCPAGTTITHTGPGSANTVTCTNTTTTNSTNTNVVTITNTNQQSATTGNVTSTGNTTSATSGGATNDNTTSSNASLSNF
jgi:signal peptidase I